jgi:hypothetical protein
MFRAPTEASPRAFVPVVYLGTDATSGLVARLAADGIGVVVVESVQRTLVLLNEFRAAVVVFALPDLQGAASVAASGTPVILLAPEDTQWGGPGVTVIRRQTDVAVLGVVIRAVCEGRAHQTAKPAATHLATGEELKVVDTRPVGHVTTAFGGRMIERPTGSDPASP